MEHEQGDRRRSPTERSPSPPPPTAHHPLPLLSRSRNSFNSCSFHNKLYYTESPSQPPLHKPNPQPPVIPLKIHERVHPHPPSFSTQPSSCREKGPRRGLQRRRGRAPYKVWVVMSSRGMRIPLEVCCETKDIHRDLCVSLGLPLGPTSRPVGQRCYRTRKRCESC